MSINTISACNIEFDATVFRSAQNKPNFSQISPMSLSALRFWPRWYLDGDQAPGRQFRRKVCRTKIQAICNGKCAPFAMQVIAQPRETSPDQEQWVSMEKQCEEQ